ncbi:biotin synthase BioB [bacterium endosymbiont of Bathymodiolus sp. 5 South]|jgi:biotin synthase|uniref:biotin synthase BioB n=1 Tax=bacterium endosymbiont of Bathymodiolus sp. 5 South TaxID=1181670 RepID=UPI0010B0561D|nr:biotin synthase BioB [bacterium endosymbiont of Bathymodiolus sp. 5 South]CAC9439810.1 Biotin synthase (EC 2.8.1.6) [uncultured Gammaproteobacteria bacterium]CAC9480011.1 Biotin synthase (EC 2.8.1.6) [uncultured Gammaproteobacteria bacterium]CAC9651465.1 Biotin synthase (EC 2.8.1.6) [uncultured Gammaproteobacteria bacterium]SHN89806.1 Biotin synthase [bacterium endosymbiont of Bathymodiolus sp. 5 South]SSC08206.1 Biotin synthase [bacterium endosymbiont of Bathymodiolus sp. 5 South]
MKELRHDWTLAEVEALFALPFNDLLFQAHTLHRENFNPNQVQVSSLLNIKTGACPEDCSYCSQSSKYDTGLEREKLMEVDAVLKQAQEAKDKGATRFCMGAAWRNPTDKSLDKVIPMIQGVKAMGMETCVTLGMLTPAQAFTLKEAGLDYYNHNLDTSEENYSNVITTRNFQDRLDTLESVQNADINVCSGGILGLGEGQTDRASMLRSLANLEKHPGSVPINLLVPIPGTPFEKVAPPTESEFVRTIAVARIMMPKSVVRLSAGRTEMGEAMQALCFFAGANSIFYGEQLLTTDNPDTNTDQILFKRLGINQALSNPH